MNSSFFPITVVVAVVLFALKEGIESIRRFNADGRKRSALRHLLARECELNSWAIKSMRHTIELADGVLKQESNEESLSIEITASGRSYCKRHSPDGAWGQTRIPDIHRNHLEKYVLDVALVDRQLLPNTLEAHAAASELEHVRDSFVDFVTSNDPVDRLHFKAFPQYALRELDRSFEGIESLYKRCTGQSLKTHRLR